MALELTKNIIEVRKKNGYEGMRLVLASLSDMAIKKEIRLRVWNKYQQRCAYCGGILEYKKMQIDHIKPLYRNDKVEDLIVWGVERGKDDETNYNPSCARCNRWKSTFSIEMFREQISLQTKRLSRDSNQYRMALDYNLIKETKNQVVFWFERCKN